MKIPVGITACNALSERFEIIVYRNGTQSNIGFTEGVLTTPVTTKTIKDKDKHGTTFIMKPSLMYMGVGGDCTIVADDLINWIEKIIYLVPTGVKIHLSIKKRGTESYVTKKYENKHGLYDYCKAMAPNRNIDPAHIVVADVITEVIDNREIERFVAVEVAFTYNTSSVEFTADSFCNFVNTVDNGVHVDAVRQAISQILTKETKNNLSEKESAKLDIGMSDVIQGLTLTVYLSTNFPPMFTSQTKSKVGNNDLFKIIRPIVHKELVKYFKDHPKDLKKCCDRVKLNAKARIEATKVRQSILKHDSSNISEHLMDNFSPCNNKGKDQYRELFVIEGLSARGTVSSGRFDRDTQAVYSLRGVPKNTFGVGLDKVMHNAELRGLVTILRCNIGDKFDINKLWYKKIIILADSDSDGFNITSIASAFFLRHLRPIVEAGMLYKGVAPLYELKDGANRFVRNKLEYISIFEHNVRKSFEMYDIGSDRKFKDREVQDFLLRNRSYLEELNTIASLLQVNPTVLEYVIMHMDDKNFNKEFHKKFSELTITDRGVLKGIYDGRYQVVILDNIFRKRVADVKKYHTDINPQSYYKIKEKSKDGYIEHGILSLGEFMAMIQKYQPVIKSRIKGLGELEARDIRSTTLDPNNRILIRLTTSDIERDMMIFDMLHGNDRDGRKTLMDHFTITREELDN